MPLDKANPANAEVLRVRRLRLPEPRVIFDPGQQVYQGGKMVRLPDQYRCPPKDFAALRKVRKERWASYNHSNKVTAQ